MTALLLWLLGAAWALEIQIRAEVAPDLASVTGTLEIRGEGWTLADPMADLPAPRDDRTLLRTAL